MKVLRHFETCDCVIHFLHNAPGQYPLNLTNGKSFYHDLLFCNVAGNNLQKMHNILFKYSAIYASIMLKRIIKILPFSIDDYDLIIAEGWVIAHAVITFVKTRKIIARIYGTTDLTEKIERNAFWKMNPFLRKLRTIVNSNKIRSIIFNSTGSRSRDLFNLLSENKTNSPQAVYLDMPNILFVMPEVKKRMVNGTLNLLHVGRMIENRGFDLTLKILDILRRNHKVSVKAVLVGDGPVREELEEMCRQLHLSDCVRFTGKLDINQLEKYYMDADILLNCYGFNPVIEGLNFKTFVITREYGEMQYILERYYAKKIFRVCVKDQPFVNIGDDIKDRYIEEAISAVKSYYENVTDIADKDFTPRVSINIDDFGHQVFHYYHDAIFG